MRRWPGIAGLLLALVVAPAAADESRLTLKYDLRRDLAATHCITCHSLDYIPLTARLPRAGWQEIVDRMRRAFGADIQPDEAAVIVDYLYDRYGER